MNLLLGINQRHKRQGLLPNMSILEGLLSRMGQSEQIKSYLNKLNDSLFLIKRCFVILVFLAGLAVFLTEWL